MPWVTKTVDELTRMGMGEAFRARNRTLEVSNGVSLIGHREESCVELEKG